MIDDITIAVMLENNRESEDHVMKSLKAYKPSTVKNEVWDPDPLGPIVVFHEDGRQPFVMPCRMHAICPSDITKQNMTPIPWPDEWPPGAYYCSLVRDHFATCSRCGLLLRPNHSEV